MLAILHPKPCVFVSLVPARVHILAAFTTNTLRSVFAGVAIGVGLIERMAFRTFRSTSLRPIRALAGVRSVFQCAFKIGEFAGTQPRPHLLNGFQSFLPTQRYPSECRAVRLYKPFTDGATKYPMKAPQALRIAHRNGERDGAVFCAVNVPLAIDKASSPSNLSGSVHAWKYSIKEYRKWH